MRALLCLLCTCFAGQVHALEPVQFESGAARVSLLELFTSEGCSSCPAAEKWLNRLQTRGDLWKTIVPVAFHVDYWDGLGWPDRFARREFTARQRSYAAEWGNGAVYTPAFVLNGREWKGFFNGADLPPPTGATAGNLRIAIERDARVTANFYPAVPPEGALRLHVALLGLGLESKVARGENSGRTLRHDFVVLATADAPLTRKDEAYSARMNLPNEGLTEHPQALAAWVTQGERPAPLQATGGPLTTGR